MITKKYIINFKTVKIDDFDSNLEIALHDLREMKKRHNDNFDFQIIGLFDGFIINELFNSVLNTFLHDIAKENHIFNKMFKDKNIVDHVKNFITSIFSYIHNENYNSKAHTKMDVFVDMDNGKQFSVTVALPASLFTQQHYEEFVALGPDHLIRQLDYDNIFNHVIAPLYLELATNNLLENEEMRKLNKYKIGLH